MLICETPNEAIRERGRQLLHDQPITHFIDADLNNSNDQFILSKLRGQFNVKGLRVLLLDWITYHNLPFETVNTERFQRILLYGNPLLEKAYMPSAKTLLRMLETDYQGAVGPVTEVLRSARSQIHFSFDGWTSKSYTSFLGINPQFVDRDFAQHRILLGLQPLRGRHSGASLANEVADTVAFWQINDRDKVGYFTLDNAANNDTCMQDLAFGLRSTCGGFDEYFPVFEILLDHLESAIEGTIYEEVEDPVSRSCHLRWA